MIRTINNDKLLIETGIRIRDSFSANYLKIKPTVKNFRDYIELIFEREVVFI